MCRVPRLRGAAEVPEGIKRGFATFFSSYSFYLLQEMGEKELAARGMLGSCFSGGKHRKAAATDLPQPRGCRNSLLPFWGGLLHVKNKRASPSCPIFSSFNK